MDRSSKEIVKVARRLKKAQNRRLSQNRIQNETNALNNATTRHNSYKNAYLGVKTVNDSFKSGGAAALTDMLFRNQKIVPTVTSGEPTITKILE